MSQKCEFPTNLLGMEYLGKLVKACQTPRGRNQTPHGGNVWKKSPGMKSLRKMVKFCDRFSSWTHVSVLTTIFPDNTLLILMFSGFIYQAVSFNVAYQISLLHVFCICLLTNKHQKYNSVELGDQRGWSVELKSIPWVDYNRVRWNWNMNAEMGGIWLLLRCSTCAHINAKDDALHIRWKRYIT